MPRGEGKRADVGLMRWQGIGCTRARGCEGTRPWFSGLFSFFFFRFS